MNDHILHKLNFATKLLLCVTLFVSISVPLVFGLLIPGASRAASPTGSAAGTTPAYTSVSIKPSPSSEAGKFKVMVTSDNEDFTAREITLANLIQLAYHIQPSQISGGPAWVSTEKFDIDARIDPAEAKKLLSPDQKGAVGLHSAAGQSLLQTLLADHFKLVVHQQAEDQPIYELLSGDGGSKLIPDSGEMHAIRVGRGEVKGRGTPLELLTYQLSVRLGRTVVDKTGLKGSYIFSLRWTPDPAEDARLQATGGAMAGDPNSPEPSGPPLFTAIQEQLGLKLEPATDRVQVLVIDQVEEPREN